MRVVHKEGVHISLYFSASWLNFCSRFSILAIFASIQAHHPVLALIPTTAKLVLYFVLWSMLSFSFFSGDCALVQSCTPPPPLYQASKCSLPPPHPPADFPPLSLCT